MWRERMPLSFLTWKLIQSSTLASFTARNLVTKLNATRSSLSFPLRRRGSRRRRVSVASFSHAIAKGKSEKHLEKREKRGMLPRQTRINV